MMLKRIERRKQNMECLKQVMSITGWDKKKAREEMNRAREFGAGYKSYLKYEFWNLTYEEQQKKYKEVHDVFELNAQKKDVIIESIMTETGWKREKVEKTLREVKDKYEITAKNYIKYEMYKLTDRQIKEKLVEIQEKKVEKDDEKKDVVIAKVMEATGWSHDEAVANIEEAVSRTECTYKEYLGYQFWNVPVELQNNIFMINHSKKLSEKYDVNKGFSSVLTNKNLANEYFDKWMKRNWGVNTEMSLEDFKAKFSDTKKIIYKPVAGHRGQGIKTYRIREDNIEDVYGKISRKPKGIIEEYVIQVKDLRTLAPKAVNTLRIVTLSSSSSNIPGTDKKFKVLYSALRIGGGTKVVDNFHQGGMVAAVDLETGTLISDGVDMDRNIYETHPLTGVKIKGFQIPKFQEALEMVEEICEEKKIDGYIGWDIVISRKGPAIIEVNTMPGTRLLSMPYFVQGIGKKDEMMKYL